MYIYIRLVFDCALYLVVLKGQRHYFDQGSRDPLKFPNNQVDILKFEIRKEWKERKDSYLKFAARGLGQTLAEDGVRP